MKPEPAQALLPPPAAPEYVQPDWRKSQVLCVKGTTCFAVILCIVAVGFASNVTNFSLKTWSHIGGDPKSRTYGLFSCVSGPDDVRGTSWSCLSRYACEGDEYGLCQTAKHVYAAGCSFFGLELFAMTFALLLIERVLYMCFTRPYGWCGIVYCLASWIFIIHITAIAFWFGISEAEFDVSCEDPPADSSSTWHVCAEKGPIAATIGIGVGAAVGLSTCFMQFHRPAEVDKTSQPIGRTRVCGKSARLIALLLFFLMLGQLALMIANLGVYTWVRTAGSHGSLYALTTWDQYSHLGYDCIKVPACLDSSLDGVCNTFTYLHSAGIAYTCCIIVAMVLWVFLMESTVHYFFGFEFGVPAINYLYGALCGLLQTLGLILWTAVSGAGFSGDCEKAPEGEQHSDLDVCFSSGFLMAFCSVILYWCTYAFWAYAYSKRK